MTSEPIYHHATGLRNHWWWRPGWRVGRRFYTWHITFDGQANLHNLISAYQRQLDDLPGLDLIPLQWLHLTMQGLGFTDEVPEDQARAITAAVQEQLANIPLVSVTFHKPVVFEEAIVIPPVPASAIYEIRDRIRAGIAQIWSPTNIPESDRKFRAHVSLAYVNADQSAAKIIETIDNVDVASASATISEASLIILGRDEHLYRWEPFASAQLGNPPTPVD